MGRLDDIRSRFGVRVRPNGFSDENIITDQGKSVPIRSQATDDERAGEIIMAFHVGQKVVCVDDSEQVQDGDYVVAGHTYEVGGFCNFQHRTNRIGVLLRGMKRRHFSWGDGWSVLRFRPIIEKKTDISFAHEILRKVSRKDRVRA